MGGKQGIHSENCISWQAGSHAELVLTEEMDEQRGMPGSAMLNPAPRGSERSWCVVLGMKVTFPSSQLGSEQAWC